MRTHTCVNIYVHLNTYTPTREHIHTHTKFKITNKQTWKHWLNPIGGKQQEEMREFDKAILPDTENQERRTGPKLHTWVPGEKITSDKWRT